MINSTNSAKSLIQIESAPHHTLTDIDENNEQIRALTEITQKGLSTARIKVQGIKKTIKSKKSQKSIEIESLEIEGNHEEIIEILKDNLSL